MDNIKTTARLAGLFSLLTIVAGGFAQGYASGRLIDFGNAATTAANIRAHSGLLYLGFAVFMIEMACQIISTALFFELFRSVNRNINLAATFLSLAGCIIKAFSRVFFIAPLLVPNDPALSLLLFGINDRGAAMALLFFGFSTPLKGYLMYRSTFLPRALGVLSIVSGLGWLTFLYPPFGYTAFNAVAGLGLIASVVVIGWLLVYGVDETRWRAIRQAEAHLI